MEIGAERTDDDSMRATLMAAMVTAACSGKSEEPKVTTKPLDDVDIKVASLKTVGWGIRIANKSKSNVFLNWNESSFARNDGKSFGSLYSGHTRKLHIGLPVHPAPIAPGAYLEDLAFASHMADWFDKESEAESGWGTITLSISVGDSKQLWSTKVAFGPKGELPEGSAN